MRLFAPVISLFLLLLSACASGPTVRYFPPQANLQQLQRSDDGNWQAQVRLQNFSNGAMQFNNLRLKIRIQDGEWAQISALDTLKVGANNAEILTLPVVFSPESNRVLGERLQKSQSVRYLIEGELDSIKPSKTYPLKYEGRLNPAPGLNGVFR